MEKHNFLFTLMVVGSGLIGGVISAKISTDHLLTLPGIKNPALHKVLGLGEHAHKSQEAVREIAGTKSESTHHRTLLDDIAEALTGVSGTKYSDVTDPSVQLLCRLYAVTTSVDEAAPHCDQQKSVNRTPSSQQDIDGELFNPSSIFAMAATALQSYSIGVASDYDFGTPMNDFKAAAYQDAMVAYNAVLGSQLASNNVPRFMMGVGYLISTSEGDVAENVYAVQQVLKSLAHKRAVDLGIISAIEEDVVALKTGVTLASQASNHPTPQNGERPRRDKMGE